MNKTDTEIMKCYYNSINESTKYKKGEAVWYINSDGEDLEATIASIDKKTGDILIYVNKMKSEIRVDPSEIDRDV